MPFIGLTNKEILTLISFAFHPPIIPDLAPKDFFFHPVKRDLQIFLFLHIANTFLKNSARHYKTFTFCARCRFHR